ncbi:MAG: Asp-tRNA(Asn)/Glu-tRNA(Gln) amidotransferase subunit GatB [Candidatus Caenarcaniphilales bacterium]|nr:Asp-tRNA(Asn)/Glu-tRNA(Gln) amidotransferase subunit GatB [Candidatus Caenarcaniphilales bacterium]
MNSVIEEITKKYEPVIGLEVHAQLKTNTKLFCSCKNEFGGEPNANTCPICLGLPGVLPVLNKTALDYAIKASLALNCTVNPKSKFDRKQYFYPDLPKGYQISQYDQPLASNGFVDLPDGSKVRINRLHMEEDAGKLVHAGAERLHGSAYSLVDLNRAGTPLTEIVTEPDIRTAEQARLYVQELRLILIYCGVCDGNLEEGSMRCDVNISLRPQGTEKFGTRAEIKNVNSFRSIQRAIEYEIERQAEILDEGGEVVQETRLWEENRGCTITMRTKEEANDYRYFPEPDLLPINISSEKIQNIQEELPLLPSKKREIYSQEYKLNEEESFIFVEDLERGSYFDECIKLSNNPKKVAAWVNGPVAAYLKEQRLSYFDTKLSPERLSEVLKLIDDGIVSDSSAKKDLIPDIFTSDLSPIELCDKKGLKQITDESAISGEVEAIVNQFPDQFSELKSGKDKMKSFFVGQAMKRFKGKASPALINKILDKLITK